jgi:peptidoglycan/LPS O-acetylase OafA/YrhL
MRSLGISNLDEMPNLDLLRSIAVLLVAVEHTLIAMHVFWISSWNIAWVGVAGVFMFFVHTSLVLMWSLERNPQVLNFYIRRIFRIYPLAIVAILAIVVFRIPLLQNPQGDTFFRQPPIMNILSNLLLMQNLGWKGNILGVMWTLPLEVDMYFLLPFLFFFVRSNFKVWPLLCLWAASAAYAHNSNTESSLFTVCIPYFVPGVIAYVLFSKTRPRLSAYLMPIYVMALLFGFMVHPSWVTGWVFAVLLGMGITHFRQIRAKWLVVASHQLAKYSYGIYLAHLFSIAIGVNFFHGSNLVVRVAAIVLSLAVIAVASYHLIERPMIRFGARLAAKTDSNKTFVPTPVIS